MKNSRTFVLGMLVVPIALGAVGVAFAITVATTPNTFVSGTPALASEVNANFAAHEAAINDNAPRGLARIDGRSATPVVTLFDTRNGMAPTVTRLSGQATGLYLVDFGFDVSDRFVFVTVGGDTVGAAFARATPGAGGVLVETKDVGGLVNTSFYVSVQ